MPVEKITRGKNFLFPGKIIRNNAVNKTKAKKSTLSYAQDVNNVSEEIKHYLEERIDIQKSSANLKNNEISFNIFLNSSLQQNFSMSGNYSFYESKLNTTINFSFQKQVDENGLLKTRQFDFTYNLQIENIIENKKSVKEDILGFVMRISQKIYKLAEDDSFKLKSIFFDKKDLDEILNFQDEKGKQILLDLVNLIILTAKMKEKKNSKKSALEIDYYPERKKKEMKKTELIKINKFNATLDIMEAKLVEKENDGDT